MAKVNKEAEVMLCHIPGRVNKSASLTPPVLIPLKLRTTRQRVSWVPIEDPGQKMLWGSAGDSERRVLETPQQAMQELAVAGFGGVVRQGGGNNWAAKVQNLEAGPSQGQYQMSRKGAESADWKQARSSHKSGSASSIDKRSWVRWDTGV